MQRQHSAFGSFLETIDINQGSSSNNTGMSQQSSMNNMLNPVENRFSNDAAASCSEVSCGNATSQNAQSFSGWNLGESSSRMTLQNQANDDGQKMDERSSSADTQSVIGPISEESQFEPTDILFPGRLSIGASGNSVRSGPFFLLGSSSRSSPLDSNPNVGYAGGSSNAGHGTAAFLGPNFFSSGRLEIEQGSPGISSDDVGPSGTSGYTLEENDGGPSSVGAWGLSCKRKSLEGSSAHSCPGGSSSCFSNAENSSWHTGSTHHNISSSLTLSPPSRNSATVSPPELSNGRTGFGNRTVASEVFPSSSVVGNEEHLRNFGRRLNPRHQPLDPLAFNLSTAGGTRRPNAWPTHQSPRPTTHGDPLDFRSMWASGAAPGLSHVNRTSALSGNVHPFPWNGSSNSRSVSSSSSLVHGESNAVSQEEVDLRNISRNSAECPVFLSSSEMRNVEQDPAGWSLASGNRSISASVSSSRIGPSSSIHPLPTPTWFPQHTAHNNQRFSEFAPWSLFPPMDTESGSHSGRFPPMSSGPSVSSSQETATSSVSTGQSHNQSFPRSALLTEGQGDDILGTPRSLRALAADIEGRHRLISEIRQVLSAMRRGESLRIEDYMLFDPFINHGIAEMHDRHRDMRLDVDNMSYEELLDLEERIGDVNTGLSEGTILKLTKQQKYATMTSKYCADLEPCCICQEEYMRGDDIGTIDCGHNFHMICIKQWLMLKNLCPICKMTALPT